MLYNKNRKNIYSFFILFLVLIIYLVFSFNNISKSSTNTFLVRDFCNWSNSFLPVSQFYTVDKRINSPFSGYLIYQKMNISPYQKDNIFSNLAIYKSNNKLIGYTNLPFPQDKIEIKDEIELNDTVTSCFIIENGIFHNPTIFFKPVLSSSVSIVNVYYLNEEEVAVAFRQNYKNNVIPILIYAYSTYLSGRFAFTSNVFNLEIYLDNELIYERKLDNISKKKLVELIVTSNRPQFIKYIVSNVTDGEHILRVKVYDFFNNSKEIQKKFSVKSY